MRTTLAGKRWVWGLLAVALWPAAAQAVPAQLNVQGVLFDETGAAVEGESNITVRVYDGAETDALLLWEPAAPLVVLCETGVFNALVPAAAEGAEAEAFAEAFADGEPRWLGIAPAGAAELSPRIPVVSVAYALVSAKAAVADVAELARGLDCAGCVPAEALDPAVQTTFLTYNPADSGLDATTYQAAIDQLAALVATLRTDLTTLEARVDGLAPVATSGAYGDLTGTPDLSVYAETADLAAVATSGAYGDLSDVPDVCAEALDCPAVLELQSRLDDAEAGLADAAGRLDAAEAELADAAARFDCLDQCSPGLFDDCLERTCERVEETWTCLATSDLLADGSPCLGGRCHNGACCVPRTCESAQAECGFLSDGCGGALECGPCGESSQMCAENRCRPRECGGEVCPLLADYAVACNAQAHCEYTPHDATGWRRWDVWIWVPAGSFIMGGPEHEGGTDGERPLHRVTFAAGFFIMKHEVVVEQYWACVEDNGTCNAPNTSDSSQHGWGLNVRGARSNHPQNGLTWQGAVQYCSWAVRQAGGTGGRLPSEAEWEYAATGSVHRRYPWGDVPEVDCNRAVFDDDTGAGLWTRPWACDACATPECDPEDPDECCTGTWPVGSKPAGASWCGALDMAGNVNEWCTDRWHENYDGAPVDGGVWYACPPSTPGCENYRVIRGSAFNYPASSLRTGYRNAGVAYSGGSYFQLGGASLGARCVRPLPQ